MDCFEDVTERMGEFARLTDRKDWTKAVSGVALCLWAMVEMGLAVCSWPSLGDEGCIHEGISSR